MKSFFFFLKTMTYLVDFFCFFFVAMNERRVCSVDIYSTTLIEIRNYAWNNGNLAKDDQ